MPGSFGMLAADLHFPNLTFAHRIPYGREILLDRVLNVFQRFILILSLRPTARQGRTGDTHAFL
jgi:hypothetical protein